MERRYGMQDVIDRIVILQAKQEAELKRLLANPAMFDVAEKLVDALMGNLLYLCNFKCAINHSGARVDIQQVIDRLKADVETTFERLTGQPYLPTVVRPLRFAREAGKVEGC